MYGGRARPSVPGGVGGPGEDGPGIVGATGDGGVSLGTGSEPPSGRRGVGSFRGEGFVSRVEGRVSGRTNGDELAAGGGTSVASGVAVGPTTGPPTANSSRATAV
jgi:hypothetical protein